MQKESLDATATQEDFALILMGVDGAAALGELIDDDAMRASLVQESLKKFGRYLDGRDQRIWPIFRAAIILHAVYGRYPGEIKSPQIMTAVDDLYNLMRYERLNFKGGYAARRDITTSKIGEALSRFTDYLNHLRGQLQAS